MRLYEALSGDEPNLEEADDDDREDAIAYDKAHAAQLSALTRQAQWMQRPVELFAMALGIALRRPDLEILTAADHPQRDLMHLAVAFTVPLLFLQALADTPAARNPALADAAAAWNRLAKPLQEQLLGVVLHCRDDALTCWPTQIEQLSLPAARKDELVAILYEQSPSISRADFGRARDAVMAKMNVICVAGRTSLAIDRTLAAMPSVGRDSKASGSKSSATLAQDGMRQLLDAQTHLLQIYDAYKRVNGMAAILEAEEIQQQLTAAQAVGVEKLQAFVQDLQDESDELQLTLMPPALARTLPEQVGSDLAELQRVLGALRAQAQQTSSLSLSSSISSWSTSSSSSSSVTTSQTD